MIVYPKTRVHKGNPHVYLTVVDEFNNRTFKLDYVPENYNTTSETLLNLGHVYTPHENAYSGGMFTCAQILDMYLNKVPFTFVRVDDIKSVLGVIGRYLDYSTKPGVMDKFSEQDKAFVENTILLEQVLLKTYNYFEKLKDDTYRKHIEKPKSFLGFFKQFSKG